MTAPSAYTLTRPFDDRQTDRGEDWRDRAACIEVGFAPFYPGVGESARPAKRICAGCEVKDRCLAEALDDPEAEGIWGGTTVRERRAMRKKRSAS